MVADQVDVTKLVINPASSNIIYATLGSSNASPSGIMKTTDGGTTWFRADSGTYPNPDISYISLAINPSHPDTMFVGKGGFSCGGLYRTTNGGEFWTAVTDTNGPECRPVTAIGIDPDSTNKIYASDNTGRIFVSTDNGETWRETLTGLLYGGRGYAYEFGKPTSTIYYAGSYTFQAQKAMFKSTDGGETWANIVNGIPGNYANVIALAIDKITPPHRLYIGLCWWTDFSPDSASGCGVFSSSDSGASWKYIGLDSASVYSLALSPDERFLYAGVNLSLPGYPRGVYRLSLIPNDSNEEKYPITQYALSQNFPNPFNPTTSLTYTVERGGWVQLTLFNILGQRVKDLVDRYESMGKYTVGWDGKSEENILMPSGVYFAVIRIGSIARTHLYFTDVKKMILMR
ncbi:MAG: T9SS type A sorting domain-containing protein [Ignavibacteriae bacterium]|nr:T9SS type A sorting domain-containing protein [Ignavibacteriota bacterium]